MIALGARSNNRGTGDEGVRRGEHLFARTIFACFCCPPAAFLSSCNSPSDEMCLKR